MIVEKCFKPLYGKCMCLNEEMLRDDCGLPVDDKNRAKLCQELGEDYYTYLVIYDGFCHEVVRVGQMHGMLYVDRGQDETDKGSWPCGTQVKFDWTASGIVDIKEQNIPEECECPEDLFTGTIKNGNCTVYFEDGKAVKEKPNKRQIQDACYVNPLVTVQDGCITDIGHGDTVTEYQSTCGKCNRPGSEGCFCHSG